MGGKTSSASINKYKNKAYDRIEIIVPKGKKEIIKEHAASKNESVNAMMNRLIDKELDE